VNIENGSDTSITGMRAKMISKLTFGSFLTFRVQIEASLGLKIFKEANLHGCLVAGILVEAIFVGVVNFRIHPHGSVLQDNTNGAR
jgi:hypothetical protein